MNAGVPPTPGDTNKEIAELIETLLKTGQRLEELTGGEIDTVADREGRTFLLRRAQEQLRDSEAAKQAAILNALPAQIALLDTQGVVISVNEAWRRFALGCGLQGQPCGVNYIESCERTRGADSFEAHRIAAGIRSVLNGSELSFSAEYPCHSPTELLWFQLTVSPLAGVRGPSGVVVSHLNVTEQRRAKEELRESERRFSDLLGNIQLVSLMLERDGRLVYCNDYLLRLTGWRQDEVMGRNWFELFVPASSEGTKDPFHALLSDLPSASHHEGEILTRSGGRRLIQWNNTVLRSAGGKVIGIASIGDDITDQRRVQELLIIESQRAEEAKLAKDRFLAAMSHEMRTPMNAILGMADLLWETELTPDQMNYVEVFRRAGSNLLVLINDILDLSKIEAGHLELEIVPFDLEDVVDQAMELAAVKAHAKGLPLYARLVPGLTMSLIGDPTRLKQILINLLGNAVKFTDRGEVVLTVQKQATGTEGEIEFSVSDTGTGIAPERLETIFDDFAQADPSIARKYGGTGLGLGISRRLIERMGGSLTATSSFGAGSTFRFTAHFQVATANDRQGCGRLQNLQGRRILVMEESATSGLILGETLQTWGVETDIFSTPEQALAGLRADMAGARRYSLALIDGCLEDGCQGLLETCVEIRRISAGLPVVMLTSDARPIDVIERRAAGLSGLGVKPLKRADLLRLLLDAMESPTATAPAAPGTGNREKVDSGTGPAARILIAEDWPDNVILMQAYLKGSPHHLTIAEDGQVAVDQFSAGKFDLILMDIQMPLMDGLTATRAIRAFERERGTVPVPIIALSANARPEDIEMSRDAGCDDHVAKPISKHKLLQVINEYGRRMKPREKAPTELPQPDLIDEPISIEELIPGYLASCREELADIWERFAASDFKSLAALGHKLKGSGGSYGFPKLTAIGAALEHSATESDPESLGRELTALSDYLRSVQPCDAQQLDS